jgi:hypothetical protein
MEEEWNQVMAQWATPPRQWITRSLLVAELHEASSSLDHLVPLLWDVPLIHSDWGIRIAKKKSGRAEGMVTDLWKG